MTSATLIDRKALSVAVFFGFLSALIWGAWPVLSRFGVQKTLSPYDIAALRFMVAGLILLPFVLKKGTGMLGLPKTLLLTSGAGYSARTSGNPRIGICPRRTCWRSHPQCDDCGFHNWGLVLPS